MNHNIAFTVNHRYKQLMFSLWTPEMIEKCTITESSEVIQVKRNIDMIHKVPVIQRVVLASEYQIKGDELSVYDITNNTCKVISNIQIFDNKNKDHVMDVSEIKIFNEIINNKNNNETQITINSVFNPKKSVPDVFIKYWVDGYKDYYKKTKIVGDGSHLLPCFKC